MTSSMKECLSCGCVLFLFCSPLIFVYSTTLLEDGYSNPTLKAANGIKPNDFISIGSKCRIEGINYQTISEIVRDTDSGPVYSCEERWQYDFVVVEHEGVLDAEVEADYFGLRTVTEQRPACDNTGCWGCAHLLGKYALDDGQPITNGYFATECWTLKDGAVPHPFWNCSKTSIANDTACYLVNDPLEILNAHLNTPRRDIMIGWILFASVALFVPISCVACVWNSAKSGRLTRDGVEDTPLQPGEGDY